MKCRTAILKKGIEVQLYNPEELEQQEEHNLLVNNTIVQFSAVWFISAIHHSLYWDKFDIQKEENKRKISGSENLHLKDGRPLL